MTPPTDQLAQALRHAADDLIDRERVAGPDARQLWGRGRRVTWVGRVAAGGLVVALVTLVAATAFVSRAAQSTMPATDGERTYPTFVSDLFPGIFTPGSTPVFAVVGSTSGAGYTYAVDRQGRMVRMLPAFPMVRDGALAPDGLHVLPSREASRDGGDVGIVSLVDGSVVSPLRGDDALLTRRSDVAFWSSDSQHVLVDTLVGALVLDLSARSTAEPGLGTHSLRPAGWRDDDTPIAVSDVLDLGGSGVEMLVGRVGESSWAKTGEIPPVDGTFQPNLRRADASPDGSRILLQFAGAVDANGGTAILVDSRSGDRVPFAGATAATSVAAVTWDECTPVWKDGHPLLASGGLRRPADGTPVLELRRSGEYGCLAVAGSELTGTPDPSTAAHWAARAWEVALPGAGVLALVGCVWMFLALRRSRRHGERFLPMIWSTRF